MFLSIKTFYLLHVENIYINGIVPPRIRCPGEVSHNLIMNLILMGNVAEKAAVVLYFGIVSF